MYWSTIRYNFYQALLTDRQKQNILHHLTCVSPCVCVCVWPASYPTETKLIYLRKSGRKTKEWCSFGIPQPIAARLSQSCCCCCCSPETQRTAASKCPSSADTIYTDGSYIAGLESMFPQQMKKTKASLNLLCLNWGDLHRCIFVCRRTSMSFVFSISGAEMWAQKCGYKSSSGVI